LEKRKDGLIQKYLNSIFWKVAHSSAQNIAQKMLNVLKVVKFKAAAKICPNFLSFGQLQLQV